MKEALRREGKAERGAYFDPETGRKIKLPRGNEWDLSKSWKSKAFDREYTDLTKTPEAVQKLVKELQEKVIDDHWRFVAVMGRSEKSYLSSYRDGEKIMIVFVNPSKTDIVEERDRDISAVDFIKEKGRKQGKVSSGDFYPDRDIFNNSLRGTGLWALSSKIENEYFGVVEKKGLLKKKQKVWFHKTGVVIFEAELYCLEDRFREGEEKVAKALASLKDEKRELDKTLSLMEPNPTGLFVKPPQS